MTGTDWDWWLRIGGKELGRHTAVSGGLFVQVRFLCKCWYEIKFRMAITQYLLKGFCGLCAGFFFDFKQQITSGFPG